MIFRTAIEDIIVRTDQDKKTLELVIHWKGGIHTQLATGKTAPTASKNCDSVACQSSTRRLLPARRPVSGACPDIRPSNRLCATRISPVSVFPASMFLPTLNLIEPPWYGPVCPVVWEGWRREVSPYPDPCPTPAVRDTRQNRLNWMGTRHSLRHLIRAEAGLAS